MYSNKSCCFKKMYFALAFLCVLYATDLFNTKTYAAAQAKEVAQEHILEPSDEHALAQENKGKKCLVPKVSRFQDFCRLWSPQASLKSEIEHNTLVYNKCVSCHKAPLMYKGLDIHRLINAERMRECIAKLALSTLAVPKKYIALVGAEWSIFAERVDSKEILESIALDEIKELACLTETTGYSDFTTSNILRNGAGRLTFIDTENNSFVDNSCQNCKGYTGKFCKYHALGRLMAFCEEIIDENSMQWLAKKHASFRAECQKKNMYNTLAYSSRYDPEGVDFEKIKEDYKSRFNLVR